MLDENAIYEARDDLHAGAVRTRCGPRSWCGACGVHRESARATRPCRNANIEYVRLGIYSVDPFVAIDQDGLGQLIRIGVEKGRSVKPKLKIGICGEHGGEPSSVGFCHSLGFDYVSCSPFRVPIARLAAAQAALRK